MRLFQPIVHHPQGPRQPTRHQLEKGEQKEGLVVGLVEQFVPLLEDVEPTHGQIVLELNGRQGKERREDNPRYVERNCCEQQEGMRGFVGVHRET